MKKLLIITLLCIGTNIVYAQSKVVKDNKGKTLNVYIPIAEENWSDDKFNIENSSIYEFQNEELDLQQEAIQELIEEEISRKIKRLSSQMKLTYNREVKSYIDRYLKGGRKTTCYLLSRANYYNPFFEEALRQYELPNELKYLPVIESGLDPKATSRVGAAGLWQFMPTTGREYDLKINTYLDERRDPVKSSYAAARFLKDLYARFGDWNLVLAAYNCGPGKVSSILERVGYGSSFWDIYPYLPKETRGYVPAFIAANYVMNFSADYGIFPEPTGLPHKTEIMTISRDISLDRIADLLGMSIADLRTLNPHLKQNIIKGYNHSTTLIIPSELKEQYEKIQPILNEEIPITSEEQSELHNQDIEINFN